MGRAWKWTHANRERVLEALRQGHCNESACGTIGGSVDQFANLLRSDSEFSEQVANAKAEGEARYVKVMMDRDPQWVLEHHPEYRKRWGKNVTIDATVTERRDFDWDAAIGPLAAGSTLHPDASGEGEGA